jgi:predicted transcriptional regulator
MTTETHERPRWSESFRVRTDTATYEAAKQLAAQRQSTVSQVAREALTRFVREEARR